MSSESVTRVANVAVLNPSKGPRKWIPAILVGVGLLLTVIALPDAANRERLSFAYLVGFAFLWSVVLGSLFFVGLQHLTAAIWSVTIRRVAEMLAAPMWLLVPLFLPVLAFVFWPGEFQVFPWADAALVEHDALLIQKRQYLNVPFFAIRAAAFFLLWILFTRFFVGKSLKQDRGEGGVEATLLMRKVSAPFAVIFAFTATLAGFDWLMSLNPHWFSTMFGVYIFSGMVVTSLAAICIGTVVLRRAGLLGQADVSADQLYNLGCLLFAFVCFWGYIAFSQYMLIWYANIPEETVWFAERMDRNWVGVSMVLPIVRFGIPFLLLLSRRAKSSPRVLVPVCILMIVGQWLDLYWLIMPQFTGAEPVFGLYELGPPLLMTGLLLLWMFRFMKRHPMIAAKDPLMSRSRDFHL